MHYYPHNISDYMLDTAHLDPMEDLAYRRLLDLYYSTESAIPLETQWVARRIRLDTQVVEKVLLEFFVKGENGWHQARCDAEIASYKALAERNKRNGSQGGRPKKTQRVSTGNPVATQSQPTGKPTKNQELRTKNQEPKKEEAAPQSLSLPFGSDFSEAWGKWESHRKEIKKPLKPTMIEEQLRMLKAIGEKRAIACIRYTIEKGWQGLREPDDSSFSQKPVRTEYRKYTNVC